MKLATYFEVISMHIDGIGSSDPIFDWEEACDALAKEMVEGRDATVLQIDPPIGTSCGMAVDVTEMAERQVQEWREGDDAPEQISDPTDDAYGEMREAMAMEVFQ